MVERRASLTDAKFNWKRHWYCLDIVDGYICLIRHNAKKKSRSNQASSLENSIYLADVVSTSFDADEWEMDGTYLPFFCNSYINWKVSKCFSLSINFWVKKEKHQRKLEIIKLRTHMEDNCSFWHALIQRKLEAKMKELGYVRPHNLLIFVNPVSGKGKGEYIYKTTISPLLKLANVEATTIFTEYAGHASKYIATGDISSYDGVIAVGGDGTFSEIANAVLVKQQKDSGISLHGDGVAPSEAIGFEKPNIRIGLIPAGSGHGINWTSQGTDDVETAVLHIICGESHPIDVSSVYDDQGTLAMFSILCTSYGFISQVYKRAENARYLGPSRYDVAMLPALLCNQTYPLEISYLPAFPQNNEVDFRKSASRCRYPCTSCLPNQTKLKSYHEQLSVSSLACQLNNARKSHLHCDYPATVNTVAGRLRKQESNERDVNKDCSLINPDWKVVRGRILTVTACTNAFISENYPQGFTPSAHLADGSADVVIVHPASRLGILRCLMSVRSPEGIPFDFPFVEIHRVKGYRLRPLLETDLKLEENRQGACSQKAATSMKTDSCCRKGDLPNTGKGLWFVDEVFPEKSRSVTVWIHRGLINIFARGIEEE